MLNRLEEIKTRFKDLEVMMTKPEIISNQVQMTKISKEYRNLENVNVLWNSYQNISNIPLIIWLRTKPYIYCTISYPTQPYHTTPYYIQM